MNTVSVKSRMSKLHNSAARVITGSFDAVSREKREINDKVLRKTLLRAQSVSEAREMQKVLASPSDSLFAIDPDVGFTSFDWPKEDSKLAKQAIKNTQKITSTSRGSWSAAIRKLYWTAVRQFLCVLPVPWM
jgi:hypothetical protein